MAADINFSLFASSCLIVINASWIGIFIISTRSYRLILRTEIGFKPQPQLHAIALSVPSRQGVKNAVTPSSHVRNLPNISLVHVYLIKVNNNYNKADTN